MAITCGTGQTTRDAARAASTGSALGVDLSSQMIDLARRRADDAGIRNARFEQADAQVHPFESAAFDVAISAAGFSDVTLDGVNAPMHFGESIDDAYRFVSQVLGWMLSDLDDSSRSRALGALRAKSPRTTRPATASAMTRPPGSSELATPSGV